MRRLALLASALILGVLLWPASSQAFVACTKSGTELTVNLTADDDSVSFQRFGSRIAVLTGDVLDEYEDYDEGGEILIPCEGGIPTVEDIDHVSVIQSPDADFGDVAIDESAGPLGPGATGEADGRSEIEFDVSLPGRRSSLAIGGTDAPETFQMGTLPSGAAGVNSDSLSSSDLEVVASGMREILVFAEGGNDLVTSMGGPGFVGPLRGVAGSADGGAGNDRLVAGPTGSGFEGGEGRDRIVGSGRRDFVEGGSGHDTILARGGDDFIFAFDRKKDRVICGAGKGDRATADMRDRVKGCEEGRRIAFPGHHRPPRVKPLAALLPLMP